MKLSTEPLLAICSALVVFVATVPPVLGKVPVKAVAKYTDEVLVYLTRRGGDLSESGRRAVEVLRKMKATGEDLSPAAAAYIKKHVDDLPESFLLAKTLRYVSRHGDLTEQIASLSRRFPGRELGTVLDSLESVCNGRQLVKELLPALDDKRFVDLARALKGNTVSSKRLQALFDLGKAKRLPMDELLERIALSQISRGRLTPLGVKLRRGTEVIPGKFAGNHGIDGIGVGEDGVPWIFEFTLSKNLKQATANVGGGIVHQMSPKWVADRWLRFVSIPENATKLRRMGVRDEFLKGGADFSQLALQFRRRLVTTRDGQISNLVLSGIEGDWILRL